MDAKLTPFESEAIRSGWLPPSAVAKVSPAMRRYFGIVETPDAGNDTRNQPLAPGPGTSSGSTGGYTAQDALPRAAGAASARGAQPSPRRASGG